MFDRKLNEIKTKDISHEVAKLISEGNVIGWFSGRSEFGPRALGNRSILCKPFPKSMKDYLNFRVKFREGFRPFAPAVLEKYQKNYPIYIMCHEIQRNIQSGDAGSNVCARTVEMFSKKCFQLMERGAPGIFPS